MRRGTAAAGSLAAVPTPVALPAARPAGDLRRGEGGASAVDELISSKAAARAASASRATASRHSDGTATRRTRSPNSSACRRSSPKRAREPKSAHRLDLDVMRSVASVTPASRSHSERAAVNDCIAPVDGVRLRFWARVYLPSSGRSPLVEERGVTPREVIPSFPFVFTFE